LAGFFAGILFLVVMSVLAAYIFVATRPGDPAEEMGALLAAPSYPPPAQTTVHGEADYTWSIRRFDADSTTLGAFRNKVVFLHFWATWCRPWCVAELPGIQALYDSLKQEDIAFILVSDDKDETALRRFLTERRLTVPVYLRSGETPRMFQTAGLPATFIVGRDGAVLFRHLGPAEWDGELSEAFLRRLLERGSGTAAQ
jgi:peroxiredoxin